MLRKLRALFRPMLSCEDVNRFLMDYLDEALDERTRTRFEAHVERCMNCSVYLEQYRTTVELIKEDTLPEPPEELVEITLDFLKDHLNGRTY